MSAEVETLMVTRTPAWHKLGTIVQEAPTSEDALHLAGLDWRVEQTPVYCDINGEKVATGDIMNYRDSDGALLGMVKEKYNIVQNADAFSFTDDLIATGEVTYESAGSLRGGKVVFMLARLPQMTVLGDAVDPYLLFSNSHDGSSAVKVCCTNVRVVCMNTLNLALQGARRTFSFVHKGQVHNHLEEAKQTLGFAKVYNTAFNEEAERLANRKVSLDEAKRIMDALFPVEAIQDKGEVGKRQLNNLLKSRDAFTACLGAADLANFKGTAWGWINAASDYAFHTQPLRMTKTFADNRMMSVINGNDVLNTTYKALAA